MDAFEGRGAWRRLRVSRFEGVGTLKALIVPRV